MKAQVLSIEGKKLKEINLPKIFSYPVREDIISKVIEAKKIKQPYSPSQMAGMGFSASGKIYHRRGKWKSHYKKGISRIPRKIFTRKGSQFNWEGASVPFAVGGRRAHPPKIPKMLTRKKINKNEMNIALISSISATANSKEVGKKYSNLKNSELKNLPFIVEGKMVSLKTKEFLASLGKIFEKNVLDIALKKKSVRAGKGKLRGRKYKSNAGAIIVLGKDEKIKSKSLDHVNVKNLNVIDLAKGSPGRLTIYTEQAINELNERYKEGK